MNELSKQIFEICGIEPIENNRDYCTCFRKLNTNGMSCIGCTNFIKFNYPDLTKPENKKKLKKILEETKWE